MNKAEIILELVKSLNMGNTCYYSDRVAMAIQQYDELVKRGIIKEDNQMKS